VRHAAAPAPREGRVFPARGAASPSDTSSDPQSRITMPTPPPSLESADAISCRGSGAAVGRVLRVVG
jgi:hypothetical protein